MATLASPTELEEASRRLRRDASLLDEERRALRRRIDDLVWKGRGADRFKAQAPHRLRELDRLANQLEATARKLHAAAACTRRVAAATRRAEADGRRFLAALGPAAAAHLAASPWGARPLPASRDSDWILVAKAILPGWKP